MIVWERNCIIIAFKTLRIPPKCLNYDSVCSTTVVKVSSDLRVAKHGRNIDHGSIATAAVGERSPSTSLNKTKKEINKRMFAHAKDRQQNEARRQTLDDTRAVFVRTKLIIVVINFFNLIKASNFWTFCPHGVPWGVL